MKKDLNPINELKRRLDAKKKGISYTEDDGDEALKKLLNIPAIPPPFKFDPPQKSRTYIYPGGDKVRIENVVLLEYCGDIHKLTTVDGKVTIVKDNWLAIEVEGDGKKT